MLLLNGKKCHANIQNERYWCTCNTWSYENISIHHIKITLLHLHYCYNNYKCEEWMIFSKIFYSLLICKLIHFHHKKIYTDKPNFALFEERYKIIICVIFILLDETSQLHQVIWEWWRKCRNLTTFLMIGIII